ncbi:MAG: CHASE2 domain-containing protein, partial [Cyanobacteria bacterium J06649_4]
MIEQRIIVNLGQGNWQQGFPTITVRLWSGSDLAPMQFSGRLPAAPGLLLLYERWQAYYKALNGNLGLRQPKLQQPPTIASIEIEEDDITHLSNADFDALCEKLKQQFNAWLSVSSFFDVEKQLRTHLATSIPIQLVIETSDASVRRFPWHLWDLLEDYRQAEVAIASLERKRNNAARNRKSPEVRVLSILGDTTGIQVSQDRSLLDNLTDVNAVVLDEPSRVELDKSLWDEQGWDVLFFAGHSTSLVGDASGKIKINATESLSIAQLKYGLQTAIKKGLRLAIFNSCDGMGLAKELADLHIPYLIVMREPIPDPVAQAFLMNFLRAFAAGIPFHLAMREARERLQGMEGQFPCASWLPVLCQNPGIGALTWHELKTPMNQKGISSTQHLLEVLMFGAIASLLILTLRTIGILEPYELSAYDQFMNWQPSNNLPERILVVEATQEDVNAYGSPIPDSILAQAVETIERYQPRVIGIDIYRNRLEPNKTTPFAPKENPLYDQFTAKGNLISTCSIITDAAPGVPPPPELPMT